MNRNRTIFILVVLIFIAGIWGSLADRKKIALEKKLNETVGQLQKLTEQSTKQQEQVLGKTAGLQETLAAKEEQISKARNELVSLRKDSQALESQLSACKADMQKIDQEKTLLENELRAAQGTIIEDGTGKAGTGPSGIASTEQDDVAGRQTDESETGVNDVRSLQEQLQTAELTIERLRQRLDAEKAQMVGLEKLLEEKNSAMEETSQDMDRLKINMDVLLSRIADQRDDLQEIQENRDLVKELAVKNEEIADLQDEVMRQPVQE